MACTVCEILAKVWSRRCRVDEFVGNRFGDCGSSAFGVASLKRVQEDSVKLDDSLLAVIKVAQSSMISKQRTDVVTFYVTVSVLGKLVDNYLSSQEEQNSLLSILLFILIYQNYIVTESSLDSKSYADYDIEG